MAYIAKNNLSGLTNITARVLRVDGSVVGAFPLMEAASAFFQGLYSFDFITQISNPPGEYLFVINSPTEGLKTFQKVTFGGAMAVIASIDDASIEKIAGKVWDEDTTTHIAANSFGSLVDVAISSRASKADFQTGQKQIIADTESLLGSGEPFKG